MSEIYVWRTAQKESVKILRLFNYILETKRIGNRIASSTLYRVHISIVIILEALEGHIIYLGR